MLRFHFFVKALFYVIKAKYKKGHGIHSPFLFYFLTEIIENKLKYYAYLLVDDLRKKMRKDFRIIKINDFGAGSIISSSKERRKVQSIAKYSAISRKYGELLFRIINYSKPKNIIELGTSLGISTSYLSLVDEKANIYTIEACEETAKIAKENFEQLNLQNIQLHIGEFRSELPKILKEIKQVDFVFFDGHHLRQPSLDYFHECSRYAHNDTIFVFDDIHWSEEMEQAWSEIVSSPKISLSIDLFRLGIVFFKQELSKEHFVIKF